MLNRIIVTGANGVGKSHFARQLAAARPDVPVISFDALKLQTNWQQRPRAEIDVALTEALKVEAWILEGGPSLLAQAVQQADVLVWLDPPEYLRGWRLAMRPWKHLGRTRPELPFGNVDWPWQQYRFALRSLRNRSKFRSYISMVFQKADQLERWHCRGDKDMATALRTWADGPA